MSVQSYAMNMGRAEALERKFHKELHGHDIDWLSEYREWLDENGIPSETDGWPSEQAYNETNIGNFIAYQLMV